MFAAIYFWIAVSTLGVIIYSLFMCNHSIESICRDRKAPLWIGYVVLVAAVVLWPVFLLSLFTTKPGK